MLNKPQNQRLIDEPELGEVLLRKIKKSKSIRIHLNEDSLIKITLPFYCSYDDAIKFLHEKKQWILKNKKRSKNFSPESKFKTYEHELEFIQANLSEIKTRVSHNKIRIYYPLPDDKRSPVSSPRTLFNLLVKKPVKNIFAETSTQNKIKEAINKALKKEAEKHLTQRLADYAKQFGLKYTSLSLRNTKTRWGSCSHDNKINLNIQLMRLPQALIDYVILHELAHCIEKNHSPKFWNLLENFTQKLLKCSAKSLDRELKNFSTRIY